MMLRSIVLAVLFTLSSALQAETDKHTVCFPKNNLHLEDDIHSKDANMDEVTFNQIIDKIAEFYKPIIKSHGAELVVKKNWKDGTVNAYAVQSGKEWQIHMFGGLARRPEVTPDGFALVVCHELGHHLAGYPHKGDTYWAATEGQSDYFATQACAKAGWGGSTKKNSKFRKEVSEVAKDECDLTFKGDKERALCYREAEAGKSLATLLAVLGGSKLPEFDTPDISKVSKTNPNHPAAQCRLDTYFHGALCTEAFDHHVIPGKSPSGGQDSLKAEEHAAQYSCMSAEGYEVGYRPRCWFKPLSGKRRN